MGQDRNIIDARNYFSDSAWATVLASIFESVCCSRLEDFLVRILWNNHVSAKIATIFKRLVSDEFDRSDPYIDGNEAKTNHEIPPGMRIVVEV